MSDFDFDTNIDMPDNLAEGFTIKNHSAMPGTLILRFKSQAFQYHMNERSLKIPSYKGPSWISNITWDDALTFIRVITFAVGGEE